MAESAVSFLLETLTSIAVKAVSKEISLQKNVREEIMEIKAEFSSMQAFLKDADAKEDANEEVKEWVKQIRDVAYETEDVLDDFLDLQRHQSFIRVIPNLVTRHQLANRVQAIKSKVKGIASRKGNYGLRRWEQGSTSQVKKQRDSREDALFVKEGQLVGLDDSRDKLVTWLVNSRLNTDPENSLPGVLAVYGEGGLGKTTLVKKVFDNQIVMAHFPCRAWVTVSETFNVTKILQYLVKQVLNKEGENAANDELKDMEANDLKKMLQNRLRGQRYIVVLDDIWKLDAWNDFKSAFPDDDIIGGSRIVVTTRFYDIAHKCMFENNNGLEFKLPHLSKEDAFKLFCKVVFSSDGMNDCPENLIEISEKFLQKCKGLPLAIVSIAGLLQTKPTLEWDQVHDNLGFLMRSDDKLKDLASILSLSYSDLPFHLKSCFLYLCIYPEDYSIQCRKLLQQWVAEGFIERKTGMSNKMTMEDIARVYLDDLISRGLVLVEEQDDLTGRAKRCRIHDIWREFIIMKAHEQGLASHIDEEGLHGQVTGRRLSILENENFFRMFKENKSLFYQLRSFMSFMVPDYPIGAVISRFRFLRVLNIEWVITTEDLKKISSYLRYLCLVNYCTLSIPSSIGLLTDLEILDLKEVYVLGWQCPEEVLKLKRLRYLSLCAFGGVIFPAGIGKLTNLEHLSRLNANIEGSSDLVKGLGMLTQMRKLVIVNVKVEDWTHFYISIEKMKYLRSLYVSSSEYEMLERSDLDKCPRIFPKLQNLIKLTLSGRIVTDGFLLRSLQDLPRLAKLKLFEAYLEEELSFEKGGFPRLKQLVLHKVAGLEKMTVEEGAMRSIEKLEFSMCDQLRMVPPGIEYLTSLKSINLKGMSWTFHDKMKNKIWKSEHSPFIHWER